MPPIRKSCAALLRPAIVVLAAAALSGCGGSSRDIGNVCPRVVVLKEASELTEPLTVDPALQIYRLRIADTAPECEFRGEIVEVSLQVGLRAFKGPGAPATVTVPIFIAATETDTEVISRVVRDLTVTFAPDEVEAYAILPEEEIKIAVAEGRKSWNYEVVIGLELTDAQIAFNRRHGRF